MSGIYFSVLASFVDEARFLEVTLETVRSGGKLSVEDMKRLAEIWDYPDYSIYSEQEVNNLVEIKDSISVNNLELGKYILTYGFKPSENFFIEGEKFSLGDLGVSRVDLLERLVQDAFIGQLPIKLFRHLRLSADEFSKIIQRLYPKAVDYFLDVVSLGDTLPEGSERVLVDLILDDADLTSLEKLNFAKRLSKSAKGNSFYGVENAPSRGNAGAILDKLANDLVGAISRGEYDVRGFKHLGDMLMLETSYYRAGKLPKEVMKDILEKSLEKTEPFSRDDFSLDNIDRIAYRFNEQDLFTRKSADLYLSRISRLLNYYRSDIPKGVLELADHFGLDIDDYLLDEEQLEELIEEENTNYTKKQLGLTLNRGDKLTRPRYVQKGDKKIVDYDLEYAQVLLGEGRKRGLTSFTAMEALAGEYTKDQIKVFNKFLLDNFGKQKVSLDELQGYVKDELGESEHSVGLDVWDGMQRYINAPNLVLQLNIKKEHLDNLFLSKQNEVDPKTGMTFEEWFKEMGELFKESGHPILPIPGRTVGWARIHILDDRTWLINEIQEDWGQLKNDLKAIAEGTIPEGLTERQEKALSVERGEEWTDFVIKNLIREYETMIMRMILKTARDNGIDSIYMLPDAVQNHILSDSKRKILYRELPKKFKFKLKSVDLEDKYGVEIIYDRKRPENNQYWHRVARVLKIAMLRRGVR